MHSVAATRCTGELNLFAERTLPLTLATLCSDCSVCNLTPILTRQVPLEGAGGGVETEERPTSSSRCSSIIWCMSDGAPALKGSGGMEGSGDVEGGGDVSEAAPGVSEAARGVSEAASSTSQ